MHRMSDMSRVLAAAALTLSFTTAPAWAQGEGSVRGQVRAAADDTVLSGIAVVLKPIPDGDSRETRTDAQGRFAFYNVRPGDYVLTAAPDGFVRRDMRFILEPREVKRLR
jgi:hypothetical protein